MLVMTGAILLLAPLGEKGQAATAHCTAIQYGTSRIIFGAIDRNIDRIGTEFITIEW